MEAPFPAFIGGRLERRDSWLWGPSSRQDKLEMIRAKLQKLVKQGLDGV